MSPYPGDPWSWFDFDLRSDRTVHVPYRVRLDLTSGVVVDVPALWVRVGRADGVAVGPESEERVPLTGIASGHVDVVPVPEDLPELRKRYPWAYRMWESGETIAVHHWIRGGEPAEEIAERLRRPPEHILARADRVEALLRAARQSAQPMTPPHFPRLGDLRQPTVHRRSGTPPWYAEAHADDPTVYWHCRIHLDLRDSGVFDGMPPDHCALTEDGVGYRETRVVHHVRLDDITSGRLDLRPVPADLTDLARTYRMAYQPWREQDAKDILWGGRAVTGMPLDRLVERLGRPPRHILAKHARLEATAAAMVREPRAEPAPYLSAGADGPDGWIVEVKDVTPPRVVAERHHIEPTGFTNFGAFFAMLTDEQITALRDDPDVEYVQKEVWVRPC